MEDVIFNVPDVKDVTVLNDQVIRTSDKEISKIFDLEVVRRVLQGEKDLYEVLLRRYNQILYRVIKGYISDENDVEDIMQNTYIHAYEKLHQFRGEASFSTWLIRIGINEALGRIRHLNKQPRQRIADEDFENNFLQIADMMNPEKQTIQSEIKRLLEKAIDHLPEKYRVVFIMREVENMSVNEVADCLGISTENVKIRTYRAKEMLKQELYTLYCPNEVLEFGKKRCDRVTDYVMNRIQTD